MPLIVSYPVGSLIEGRSSLPKKNRIMKLADRRLYNISSIKDGLRLFNFGIFSLLNVPAETTSWQLCGTQVETSYQSDERRLGTVSGTSLVVLVT